MNEEVRKIMTINPPIATPNQKVSEIADYMLNNNLQQLPVTQDGKLVGMLTTYDMWKALRKSPDAESLQVIAAFFFSFLYTYTITINQNK